MNIDAMNAVRKNTGLGTVRKALLVTCAIAMLAGCQNMSNRDAATAIGAGLGTVAGSFFGKGYGRLLGATVGAVVGGLIGNEIGKLLDEQQQVAVGKTSANALTASGDGRTAEYSDGKAVVVITPSNSRTEQKPTVLARDRKVEKPVGMEVVGADFRAASALSVLQAPRAGTERLSTMKKGEVIRVAGRVDGGKWSLVSRNGKSIGYVETSKLEAVPVKLAAIPTAPTSAAQPQPQPAAGEPTIRKPIDLDASPTEMKKAAVERGVIDLDADDVVVEKVVASVPCRDLTTKVSVQGKSETAQSTACKAADGAWEL